MRIFYTHDIFSAQKFGGVSRYFFEVIKRISKMRSDVQVFAGLYVNEFIKELSNIKTGFKVPAIKHTGRLRLKLNSEWQNLLLSRDGCETLVHQTYFYQFTPRPDFKYVVTVYDMIRELFPRRVSSKQLSFKRECCKKADKIIAISHSTKNDLVRFYDINPDKVAVIHLASSLSAGVSGAGSCCPQKPFLLYVGKRGGHKNFTSLLYAFSQSKDIKECFRLICFGGRPFNRKEKKELNRLGVGGRIQHVTGNDSALAHYYKSAHAYVCPSIYEGFGIPLLEAMSLSCPVICSNTSSIPEVVGNAGTYFDPNDTSSIQDALERTLFDERLLSDLKQRGRHRASIFSWDKCADQTLAVYDSVRG